MKHDPRDVEDINTLHLRYCDQVGDAAMELQDRSYALGLERGRSEQQDMRNWSVLAFRAMDDAAKVLETLEGDDTEEADRLAALLSKLQELCLQCLTLHRLTTRGAMDEKYHFNRIDL